MQLPFRFYGAILGLKLSGEPDLAEWAAVVLWGHDVLGVRTHVLGSHAKKIQNRVSEPK